MLLILSTLHSVTSISVGKLLPGKQLKGWWTMMT
jgi:hypothetical protein